MTYVSAKYSDHDLNNPSRQVRAIDDRGTAWSLTLDSQVGDWIEYLEWGGTIQDPDPMVITAEQVDIERDKRIENGFVFDGTVYQSRAFDRNNIAGATQAATLALMNGAQPGDLRWADPDNDFVWIAADNSLHPMDAQTMIQFGQTLMGNQQAHIFASRNLKDTDPIPLNYQDDVYWPPKVEA